MNLTLDQITPWLSQANLIGDAKTPITRVHTDTRSLRQGDLFVAIKGDNFDANDLLVEAKSKGASAAIAHNSATLTLTAVGLSGIEVPDTRRALGEISRGWRQHFKGQLVAITGSNGKTTATQMLASIFRTHAGDGAHATRNSFNNDIGLPLTLLGLNAGHTLAAVEIGMSHVGEIDWLASLAQPTVALVNNAQREHQEFMVTVEAVARENACVFDHVPAGGTVVFPADDAYTPLWREMAEKRSLRVMTFGAGGDVHAVSEWHGSGFDVSAQTPQGPLSFTLSMPGEHNVKNALAASACAIAAGVPFNAIATGLGEFEAVAGRSRALVVKGPTWTMTLIDDSYNANPDSVRAAIDVLAQLPSPRVLVLGDMGEVGSQGAQFHAEVGLYAAQRGIDLLLTHGILASHSAQAYRTHGSGHADHIDNDQALLGRLSACAPNTASMLIKGSRFMRMERAVNHVTKLGTSQDKAKHVA